MGKWKLIESADNNGKLGHANRKFEFFSDSTYKFSVETGKNQYFEETRAYRIDSHYLHRNLTKERLEDDDNYVETYTFYKDKLRLEYFTGNIELSMGTPTIFVYQRIK